MTWTRKLINTTVVGGISKEWSFGFEHLSDPRTQEWPLVSSYKNVAAAVLLYLFAVLYLRKLCKRFKPLRLQKLLLVYNALMTLLNIHIFKELLLNATHLKYNYWCQSCQVIYSTHELRMAAAIWWFYISKILEFSDSIFFMLRHKWNQLTPLHIYHHSTMAILWWIAVKWVPTGSSFFPALINSFVHIVMYSYYGLSACGPWVYKYLWWKKYLTALQLIQFSIGLVWAANAIISHCDFPVWINYATAIYMITFLILFSRFYSKTYTCKKILKQKR